MAKTRKSFGTSFLLAVLAAPLGACVPQFFMVTYAGLMGDRFAFDNYGLIFFYYIFGLPVALVGTSIFGTCFYHFAEGAYLRKFWHYAVAGLVSGFLVGLLFSILIGAPSYGIPLINTLATGGASCAFVAASVFWYLHIRPANEVKP